MPGPAWNDDDPHDSQRLRANSTALLRRLRTEAPRRTLPDLAIVCRWHADLYAGCRVPVAGYVGHLRGDPSQPDLVGYEVGVGPLQPDGLPAKVGVWSTELLRAVNTLLSQVHAAVTHLDSRLPIGVRPSTVDELEAVVRLTAAVHGEWIRLHPFASGNGRTARVWAGWLALRYSLPVFVIVKPRPGDMAYTRAARDSMGRPPDFVGDHSTAVGVFGHMLSLRLMP